MGKLEMYNVKFGDCFILSEQFGDERETESLLVDFGSEHNIVSGIPNILPTIKRRILNGLRRCLVTHFHEDHIKGLKLLSNDPTLHGRIKEIIVPNICFNKPNFKVMLLILKYYRLYSREWWTAYNYIRSATWVYKLLGQTGYVSFVSEGTDFHIAKSRYEILSPQVPQFPNLVDNAFFQRVTQIIGADDDAVHNNILSIADLISDELAGLFNFNDGTDDGTAIIMRKNPDIGKGSLDALMRSVGKFSKLKLSLPDEMQSSWDALWADVDRKWNSLSIVFRKEENSLLMTGDMTCAVWNRLKTKFWFNNVNVFKVPHHGTLAHFCDDFPTSDNIKYLIPNARDNWVYRLKWRIAKEYPMHYTSVNFDCTNNCGCEEYKCNGNKSCTNANNCGWAVGTKIDVSY